MALCLSACVTGSKQLSQLEAHEIKELIVEDVTTMEEVQESLGEPQSKGIRESMLTWYYRYQDFAPIPFIPGGPRDVSGYLMVQFDDDGIVRKIDYYGDK